ncbi:carbamoyl phosphate synthase [Clostridium polyendosporum]|uniref:Carbamoyl phosphate synthase n=1 Tax=Clostridium polyendosporum TaxID=69208 RepID=A0A919VG22_9CLOT|nr:ATP-grasp domain-containing protein [Clostridium polyendosporum]GIM28757.1 carbamoyl phosphate synthase [Clostridium polyendosporum]
MAICNTLILSAGRRVELIKCFKEAAKAIDTESKIIAVDISNTAPAIYFADKYYIIPRIEEKNYVDSLINICRKEDIKLIIPTIDTELLVIAENKMRIERDTDAKVLISDINVINVCRNKFNTNKFFEENKFGAPKLITKEDIKENNYKFPLFIKPVNGSSSINAFKINSKKELEFFIDYVQNPIIQEFIQGEEFTVDAFLDFEGNPITIVPRKRLAVRSGEVLKGLISKDREIIEEVKRLLSVLKPIGQITIQCIKTETGIKFIEINPRFGGGAPMSIKVGANSSMNLYKILSGEKLYYNEDYEDNIICLRFDNSIFLDSFGMSVL